MDTQIKVYLNEGEDHFFGFHNKFADSPRLRLALVFDWVCPVPLSAQNILETVFEQLNIGGDLVPAEPWTEQYRHEHNRSLSVGDVVVVGETAWACESTGWQPVPTDELVQAIRDFNVHGAAVRR